jgi:hypothetical protein
METAVPTTPKNLQVMGSEFTTPPSRPNYEMRIAESVKDKVRLAGPIGDSCLITKGSHSVDFCHCIPRRILKEPEIVCLSTVSIYIFGSE